jgi:hypothetical protein
MVLIPHTSNFSVCFRPAVTIPGSVMFVGLVQFMLIELCGALVDYL